MVAPFESLVFRLKRGMKTKLILFISLLFNLNAKADLVPPRPSTIQEMQTVLGVATKNIMAEQKEKSFWLYPSHLGLMYVSQYYLMTHWLGLSKQSALDPSKLAQFIVSTQLKDGSWEILHDDSLPQGDINASIYNYWALKAMGYSIHHPVLAKARDFILKHGGLGKASQFTRVFLTLFNNLNWSEFPSIPYMLFESWSPANERQFGQWVGPHLITIAYLKKNNVFKNLGPAFRLDELKLMSQTETSLMENSEVPDSSDMSLIRGMFAKQKVYGSVGGYTSATQLAMAVFDHMMIMGEINNSLRQRLQLAKDEGFRFVESMYIQNPDGAYKGVTCDGRYWDTALVGQGLLEAGVNPTQLNATVGYLEKIQNEKSGGYGFGHDFENYEDTDDTAEILLFYQKAKASGPTQVANQKRALQWLLKMQNSDGGWGAFDKDNTGNFLLEKLTSDFLDSADLFDESSPDVTGHILEALGSYGYTINNSEAVQNAVDYLRETQVKEFGGWEGRWGVNYIYGTSAAVIGLLKVGVPASDPMIQQALNWFETCPNRYDGGLGESFLSYTYNTFKCGGRSTPTQTAWALMALVEGGRAHSATAQAAASFLTRQYNSQGTWIDVSFVGTGHPRIVPMAYPAYPKSFTLMALARYLKAVQ